MDYLKINQQVEITVNEDPYSGKYLCRVQDINDDEVLIDMPLSQGSIVPLRPESMVRVTYFGKDGVIYEFDSSFTRERVDNVPVMRMPIPNEIRRIQRRSYVRIEISLPVRIFIEDDLTKEVEIVECSTIDVSGGGARLLLSKEQNKIIASLLEKEEDDSKVLKMSILLREAADKYESINCVARIVRVGEIINKHFYAINFEFIEEKSRDKIIAYIFKKQMELRNKGII